MAQPRRYFVNNLPDYHGGEVQVPESEVFAKCVDLTEMIFRNHNAEAGDDESLYVGNAGIAYMCYYLARHPRFAEKAKNLLEKGENYMKRSLSFVDIKKKKNKAGEVAFVLGGGGVYVLAAAYAATNGKNQESETFVQRYGSLADICLQQNFLNCGGDELFVGRAGYLTGIWYLKKNFGINVLSQDKLFLLCQTVVDSGKNYSRKMSSPCPLMYAYYGTEYLGAAHGLTYILQILLGFPEFLASSPKSEQLVKASVDFMLSLQNSSGNFPCAMDEVKRPRPEEADLVHWCHGAPGVVYLMAAAYRRWNDDKYLQSCLKCGECVWKKGLLRKGPGICHGVAGSGYVFLLLYRLTKNPLHLHRAIQFASFMFTEEFRHGSRTPDSPYSLYEGYAGTVCYLSDLLDPMQAQFPFCDVF